MNWFVEPTHYASNQGSMREGFPVEAYIHSVGDLCTYRNTLVTALVDVFSIETIDRVNISRRANEQTH